MAVTFYPSYTIQEIENQIYNNSESGLVGEWLIYRELFQTLSKSKDSWYVWYSYQTAVLKPSEHVNKTESEIDFIIVGKKGILVLEVKGGELKIQDSEFYCNSDKGWLPITNPFVQGSQNKHLLREQFLKQFSNLLVCEAVALPSTCIAISHSRYDNKLIYSKYNKDLYGYDIEGFINSVFDYSCQKLQSVHALSFESITRNLMQMIRNILNVSFQDHNPYVKLDTLKWLQINNLEVLDALDANPRLMIQGEAGTGKTTLALGYADRHRGLKGLYICWSVFLRYVNQDRFSQRGIDIDTWNYFEFVVNNTEDLCNEDAYDLSYEEFSLEARKAVLNYLENGGAQYDYIIVDEAQDLFDRNIDFLIDKLCKSGNGLEKGMSLILYDFRQSFNEQGRDIKEYAYLLKEYYAHYKLISNKRSLANTDIQITAQMALKDPGLLLSKDFYTDMQGVTFSRVGGAKELNRLITRYVKNSQDTKSSLKPSDVVFLGQAYLLKNHSVLNKTLSDLDINPVRPENVLTEDIKCTTPIRYKGLEKKYVVFFIGKVNRASNYEWYMAVSRAINHIEVVWVDF